MSAEYPLAAKSTELEPELNIKWILIKTLLVIVFFVATVAAIAHFFRAEVEHLGTVFINMFGYWGIGIGTLISDTLAVPIVVDIYMSLGLVAGLWEPGILMVATFASVLGGNLAWGIGRKFSNSKLVHHFRRKGESIYRKYGVMGVILGALTPLPFAPLCIMAGAFGMHWRTLFLCTLTRIPRVVGYYYAIKLGWVAGIES
jgi:membrane protein YqaA with SNARE-associated domain